MVDERRERDKLSLEDEKELSVAARGVAAGKKSYRAPVLVEYGTIAKLTQTGATSGADGSGMMGCL